MPVTVPVIPNKWSRSPDRGQHVEPPIHHAHRLGAVVLHHLPDHEAHRFRAFLLSHVRCW